MSPTPESSSILRAVVKRPVALAVTLWIVSIAGSVAGTVLSVINGWPLGVDPWGILVVSPVVIGSMGALVASRVPTNALGWMMLAMAVLNGLAAFGLQYGYLGVFGSAVPPAAELIATVPYGLAIGVVFGLTITFFLLLFPDGRLPSYRWRPVAWVAGLGIILMSTGLTFFAIDLGAEATLTQVAAGALNADLAEGPALFLNNTGHVLVFLVFPAAVASLFVRRRRAGPQQRQQLKWFSYGATIFLTSVFAPLPDPLATWYEIGATAFLFIAIGVAILRYRLYDIDRIVSRTVAYAGVTAVLVAVYLSAVFLIRLIIPADSELTVAASTLAAAGLFNPLRRYMQAVVDRRFNRSRYDAARTVELFSRSLRDAVGLAGLGHELQGAAAVTMQPRHLSLWIREDRR